LKIKKQKFEKPSTQDLIQLLEGKLPVHLAQLLLEQIEELCLIIIEHYASRQTI
jgi:hypothetical protein